MRVNNRSHAGCVYVQEEAVAKLSSELTQLEAQARAKESHSRKVVLLCPRGLYLYVYCLLVWIVYGLHCAHLV